MILKESNVIGQGLQYKVYQISDDKVFKLPNNKKQKIEVLKNWQITDEKEISKFINKTRMLQSISCEYLIDNPVDLDLFGNPEIYMDHSYKQDKLIIPSYQLDIANNEVILKVIDDFLVLSQEVWKFGLYDTVMNIFINCGYNKNGKLVFCDFGELTKSFERAKKQIKEKNWENSNNISKIPNNLKKEVINRIEKVYTLENLTKHWKINLR
jgi:hypothetical protein